MTERADCPDGDAAYWDAQQKRDRALRAAKKRLIEEREKQIAAFGEPDALRLVREVYGIPDGKTHVHDALHYRIDLIVAAVMSERGGKLKHGDRKLILQYVQDGLRERPLTKLNVDEHGAEMEQVEVYRSVEDEMLRQRVRAAIKRFEEQHSS
jgi:hypothetical protein